MTLPRPAAAERRPLARWRSLRGELPGELDSGVSRAAASARRAGRTRLAFVPRAPITQARRRTVSHTPSGNGSVRVNSRRASGDLGAASSHRVGRPQAGLVSKSRGRSNEHQEENTPPPPLRSTVLMLIDPSTGALFMPQQCEDPLAMASAGCQQCLQHSSKGKQHSLACAYCIVIAQFVTHRSIRTTLSSVVVQHCQQD